MTVNETALETSAYSARQLGMSLPAETRATPNNIPLNTGTRAVRRSEG